MSQISLISLGANQQDPIRTLNLAAAAIQALSLTQIQKSSSIIMTTALGYERQQDFFNQVLKISPRLRPIVLLDHLQNIEITLGRVRRLPWGPRMIDIDILSYGKIQLNHPRLILPHPQMETRPFVRELIQQVLH